MNGLNFGQTLARDGAKLAAAMGLDQAAGRIETQALLTRALKLSPAYLAAHNGELLDEAQQAQYFLLFERRMQGEPVAYIVGTREFYGLDFRVTPEVLIPRPETELLVESALAHIRRNAPCRVLDLGTGSGNIAITIAIQCPLAEVIAGDISEAALSVARENAGKLDAANVVFIKSDWFSALGDQKFDVIVSNPPYVAAADPHLHKGDLRFEPGQALMAGPDGLDAIRKIVASAPRFLSPSGWLLFEHGYDQAEACRDLLKANAFSNVFSSRDLAGIPRVAGGHIDAAIRLSLN